MADNLAMAKPGHHFVADGLQLSWPIGGERQVVYFPPEQRSRRIQNRIVNGAIVETNDEPTIPPPEVVEGPRLFIGDEARKRLREPAPPVTRSQADPETKEVVQVPVRSLNLPRVEPGQKTPSFRAMRKSELVAYAEMHDVDSSGSKADIIARLEG
jgi:hypothetical protein